MIAALYVQRDGCYWNLPGVDAWDEARDARLYAGPHPVVAHPPCKRWGKYWYGDPLGRKRFKRGDDGGCFASALEAVRRFGGVLEHPAGTSAWEHFGITKPSPGAWIKADEYGGWTCQVDQSHYGHRAQKSTWLYAVDCGLPDQPWQPRPVPDPDGRTRRGMVALMSHRERDATPPAFRDMLLGMAGSVAAKVAA